MKITLKDGSVKEYENNMSVIDIAKDISEGLARVACAGEVDGEVVDLRTVIDKDCELNILTFDSDEGKHAFRHTASHILAQAVKRLYPETKLAIGPSIDNGFYYDMEKDTPFTQEDLEKIEKEMKKIVKENLEITSFTKPRDEAIAFMKERNEPYKVELIEDLPEDSVISFYQQGEFVLPEQIPGKAAKTEKYSQHSAPEQSRSAVFFTVFLLQRPTEFQPQQEKEESRKCRTDTNGSRSLKPIALIIIGGTSLEKEGQIMQKKSSLFLKWTASHISCHITICHKIS